MIFGFAQHVVLSSGWRRRAVACLSGACGALAMAPFGIVPALIVSMVVAVWLLDGCAFAEPGGALSGRTLWATLRSAAGTGWWWGFGYFVAGLWWLGSAFLVEADKFAWLLPLGVLGLPAYLAIFSAFGFALARLLWSPGPARILALAASLTLAEWLRGVVLTGFPWNEFGMALGGHLMLGQFGSLVGLHGLTLLTILLAAAPATLFDPSGTTRARRLAPSLAALLCLAAIGGYGFLRLGTPGLGDVPGVKLRIMQPNTTMGPEFNYSNKEAILHHYLTLSDQATSPTTNGLSDVTHLIWPESAFPFILSRDPDALADIGASLPPKTLLLTGAARLEQGAASPNGRPEPHYFNAVQVVNHEGAVVASYDKIHLVPFGEYLPFQDLLHSLGLRNFVTLPGGFEAGTLRRLLQVPGLPPVAVVVCCEAIFSGDVVPEAARSAGLRPGLLLNVTDDGWFGFTTGPYQHFAQARLRAIEEGLPLVRAASTGISAIIDPYGRTLHSLPLGAENVIDGSLPKALGPTPFALYGNSIPLALLTVVFLLTLVTRLLPLGKVT